MISYLGTEIDFIAFLLMNKLTFIDLLFCAGCYAGYFMHRLFH